DVRKCVVQVQLVGLHLGTIGKPGAHVLHGPRVDVGHDMSIELGELAGELAQSSTDLEHRGATVLGDQLELVGPVPPLVRTGLVVHTVSLVDVAVALGEVEPLGARRNNWSRRKKRNRKMTPYTARNVPPTSTRRTPEETSAPASASCTRLVETAATTRVARM